MTIQLSSAVEKQVRLLARKQRRALRIVVEDALKQYVEAAAITDLDAADVAATQDALSGELPRIGAWKARRS